MTRANQVLPLIAAAAAIVALIALTGGVSYAVFDQRETDRALCGQTVENRKAIRATWNAARRFINKSQPDPALRKQNNLFFDAVLHPIPLLECVDNQPVRKGGD